MQIHKMAKDIFVISYFSRKNGKVFYLQNLSYLLSFNQILLSFFGNLIKITFEN